MKEHLGNSIFSFIYMKIFLVVLVVSESSHGIKIISFFISQEKDEHLFPQRWVNSPNILCKRVKN